MEKSKLTDNLVENSILASPPDLLFKIINSLDSELSSYQIGEIIGHDQSVSAQVLKLSNSSFFGFKGEIKTLDRAINILGTKTVRNIAVTTLLFTHTNKIKLYNLNILEFWLQTFLVADVTRELSQKVGLDGDEAYIAGLLHYIGKLILYAKKQDATDLFKQPHTLSDILEYEKKSWAVTSIELTEVLLHKWNIPDETVRAIAEHGNLNGPSVLGKVVFLADVFGSIITDKHYVCRLTLGDLKKILKEIGISTEDFYKFTTEIPGIAERGRMIMKVLSKNKPVATFNRLQNRATLVTPYEFSLAKSLLTVLGFNVEVIAASRLTNYSRDMLNESHEFLIEDAEPEVPGEADTEAAAKGKGLFGNFMGMLFHKKETAVTVRPKDPEETREEQKPISWNPMVVFEHIEPVPINRLTVTVYYIPKEFLSASKEEAVTFTEGTEKSPIFVLPVFFANADLKEKK